MNTLSIKSSFKLNSGYEMPLLGFGVNTTNSRDEPWLPSLMKH